MSGTIIVVTHKEYPMPADPLYLPVCVGKEQDALRDRFQPDSEGENIADKNDLYCELTALYWAWKNLHSDYIGLVHYRRYLSVKKNSRDLRDVLRKEEAEALLGQYDILVPKRRIYLQTVADHYIRCIKSRQEAHKVHLRLLREVLADDSPASAAAFDAVMNGHTAHMLNMFVMKREDLDSYCRWMFGILFRLEQRIREENVYYERIMGALGEFLLDVWIQTQRKTFVELNLLETEKSLPAKIRWALKRRLLE